MQPHHTMLWAWEECSAVALRHVIKLIMFFYEGSGANFRINKQIHRHQVIKSAKNRQSHYPRGRLVLNQNYPRCIFIRTDCEIWAVKTWVIVALETDITHFPSRSWQWHANFVFSVCVFFCRPFVYMCEGSEERGRTSSSMDGGGGGERWESIILDAEIKQYGPPPHTLYLASDPGLCHLQLPSDVCLETIFPGTERKITSRGSV